MDKKARIIAECSVIFGELQDCKCYVPRKFFRKSTNAVMKEFKKGLKQIDKAVNSNDDSLADDNSNDDSISKTVAVVNKDLQKSSDDNN